jgi:cyanate lyase
MKGDDMTKVEMSEAIIIAKKEKELSWEAIASQVGLGTVFITSAALGMNSLVEEKAKKLCDVLSLGDDVKKALMEYPTKKFSQAIPTDPLIYRLYEIVGVYGDTLKEVIQEKFGDGIMSAIDYSMSVDKEENPKGDRVVITMNGKFLPYKAW